MRRTSAIISAFALMLTMFVLPAAAEGPVYSPPLGEEHTGPGRNCNTSITIDGTPYPGTKLDGNPRGTFALADGVSITVGTQTVTANGGTAILCVKGGNEDPNSGTVVLGNGQTYTHPQAISNIVWYRAQGLPVFPEGALSVVKTAAGDVDRTVRWTIDKTVDPATHRLLVGGSADSDYEVDVTKSEELGNYVISGSITIGWSGSDASVSISSIVDSIQGATVSCPGGLPANVTSGQTLVCTYTAPGASDVTSNTVTVGGSYVIPPGFQNAGETVLVGSEDTSPTFGYSENLIGFDTVNVTDTFAGGAATPLGTVSQSTLFPYDRTFTCSERGTFTYPNTATIVETNQSDSALVTVECVAALEACTPGFWGGTRTSPYTPANKPAWDYLAREAGISPSTTLHSVGLTGHNGLTFNQVFNTQGRGNYAGSLVWHAAAAFLNATMADEGLLDFPMTPGEVVDFYLDRDKDALANANEDGDCPFGADFPSNG